MRSKFTERLIIQCTPPAVFAKSPRVSLKELPLNLDDTQGVITLGRYTVKKKPGVPGAKSKKFVINSDLFLGNRLRVANYRELVELGKTDIRVRFLLRNTNICKGLFDIANNHRDLPLPFAIDWIKYKKHVQENSKEELKKDFLRGELDNDD